MHQSDLSERISRCGTRVYDGARPMPRKSFERPISLTEVVYDVRSPHGSVSRPQCGRSGWSRVWGLHSPDQPSICESSLPDARRRCVLFVSCELCQSQSRTLGLWPLTGRAKRFRGNRAGWRHAVASRFRLFDEHSKWRAHRARNYYNRRESRAVCRLRDAATWLAVSQTGNGGSGPQDDSSVWNGRWEPSAISVPAGRKRNHQCR